MIRITADISKGSRLVVEGHLSGSAVDELRKCCAGQGARTVLELSGVSFADRSAAVLLNELSAAGFVIEGCSGFLNELLLSNGGGMVR
jgi:anti-anti-sigma regulatory factor